MQARALFIFEQCRSYYWKNDKNEDSFAHDLCVVPVFVCLSVDCVSHIDASFCKKAVLRLWLEPLVKHFSWTNTGRHLTLTWTKNSSLLDGFAASHWPFDVSLAEFPSGCREQSCVCVESESKGNMSHDHLLSKPNEAPFALSNLPLTSVALATKCPCRSYKSCLRVGSNHYLWCENENL